MSTRLRPARPDERSLLLSWAAEVTSEFEDWRGPDGEAAGRVGNAARGGELVVTDGDDQLLGTVTWRAVLHGPTAGSEAFDIGISLRPPARGRGHGHRAQRMLADWLFATTSVHRVQASTDVDNASERRALERAGFQREGVLRGAQWRLGAWHDLVSYARLRGDG